MSDVPPDVPPPDMPPPDVTTRLPAPPAPGGLRHVELADLPPAVAQRLRYTQAAPRRLRGDRVPDEVQAVLRDLWDGIVADVYDEVAGLRRTKMFNRKVVERVLLRVRDRMLQAQRVLIVTGVYWPMPGDADWKHLVVAGVGGGGTAAAEELAAYGSFGTGATVAFTSAIVGELFELYVASSARTHQYRRAGRSPAADVVAADLAQVLGLKSAAERRAGVELTREAITWLDEQLLVRTSRRFARGLVPVVGVAAGAGFSGVGVRKVLKLALRPPSEDEVVRLATEVVHDRHRYAADRERFEGLPQPPEHSA